MNNPNNGVVELQVEDSDISLEIEQDIKDLTIHVDFDVKMEQNERKLNMFIEIDPKMINNLTKELAKLPNGFQDERKLFDKNCIFSKKIQTPNSFVKGTFYLTYLAYKGLTFNVFLKTDD